MNLRVYNVRMLAKNNVTRLLDSRNMKYLAYELPVEKIGALETARLLNIDPGMVFKTIVVECDRPAKALLAVVPGNRAVDLRLLSVAVGEKKLRLPTEREAEDATGLQAGGISPLALINKRFQVVIDSCAQNFKEVHISGGQRGLNIRLSVADLETLTKARFAAISRPL